MIAPLPRTAAVPTVPPNFNRLAGIYRWLEWITFGPWLSRCRRAFIERLADRRSALVIGDGDGRFTSELLAANSRIEVDAVDASPAMLRALERHAGKHQARVRAQVVDAREWQPCPDRQYDSVATHFFLDCLTTEEVRRLAHVVRPALLPGALWVISDFAIPNGVFGRWVAGPVVGALYAAFGLLTGVAVLRLPDHGAALRDAGFALVDARRFLHGLLMAQVWAANPFERPA